MSQNIDYETIVKSKPLKVSGIVSANGVYYNSNQNRSRAPFTYFLQGTINISLYSFSIPITYSYSNQGEDLGYQLPFNFNRLSLHPKYKWITAHIGSVAMSFSPYTLSGHQFTGGGLDLTPKGPFKISAMGGRLLKATEDDGNPRTVPAFDRFGYGFKTSFEKEKFKVGLITFYAKDDVNSLDSIPESKGVLPKENLVVSFEGQVKLNKQFTLQAEYATTGLTSDTRAANNSNTENFSPLQTFFKGNTTTAFYNAIKTNLNYAQGRTTVGINYERIDPGYATLGAYFFNNDFENITVNATNSFFKDKLTLALNIGLQRDDLDGQKANNTNRTIGSINGTLMVNERLSLTGMYSNFTTFTNVKPNQFEDINDNDLTDEALEDLDFRQLSQTANLNVNYLLSTKKEAQQNLNINYNLSDVANEQGGIVRVGDASTFHNLNVSHSINFKESAINLTSGINATYNTIGREDATTWGPTVGVAKSFFEKTLNARISSSYNQSQNTAGKSSVINFRAGATYLFKKKHNFNLNATQLFRSSDKTATLSEFTATFGYNYAFGFKKPKINLDFNKRDKKDNDTLTINYKKYHFKGTPIDLTPQLVKIPSNGEFPYLTTEKKKQLQSLEEQLYDSEKKDKKVYKSVALAYLKSLSDYTDFKEKYYNLLYYAYLKLGTEAENISYKLEKELLFLEGEAASKEKVSKEEQQTLDLLQERFGAHIKLVETLREWNITPEKIETAEGELQYLRDKYLKRAFQLHDSGKTNEKIVEFLEIRWADYFHKRIND